MSEQYDIVIIGAGVCGSAVARELSRRNYKILVLEKDSDLCEGTSKANSGIVHAGFDAIPGSKKAELNILGNKMMEDLSHTLDFPFKRNGSMVVSFNMEGMEGLKKLYERGVENGVEGLQLLSGEEARKQEPSLADQVQGALFAPTGGIVCPFGLNIALAENAAMNGVEFHFHEKVIQINSLEEGYELVTSNGSYWAKVVVNAAGVYADEIHNMVSSHKLNIIPRRGQYCLFDKKTGDLVTSTIFQIPTSMGKGILITPTVHGNLLAGPTAEDIEEKEGINTTQEGLEQVLSIGGKSVANLPNRQIITSFSGLRAHEHGDDFVLGEAEGAKGFYDVAGIASPGLTSAPAIGCYIANLIQESYPAEKKENFIEKRKGIPNLAEASYKEKEELIRVNKAYANVICRCELITEGEILDAIHRPLGATTLDGIKRRTRAGMGRCQGGFCSPKVLEIIAKELNINMTEVTKAGEGSYILADVDREVQGC